MSFSAPMIASDVSSPNCHRKLLLGLMASLHGCLKPPLHILSTRFVTFSTCLSPLAWYLLTGSPPSLSLSPNYPLLPILHQIMGLSHSFVLSVNFLKSTFIPFSLIFVRLSNSFLPSSSVSSLNGRLSLPSSSQLTPRIYLCALEYARARARLAHTVIISALTPPI